jgi:hypothetical protein
VSNQHALAIRSIGNYNQGSMKFFKDLPWTKLTLLFYAFLFTVFMAWSVLYETLLPLYRAGDMDAFNRNLAGIPLIFIGVGLFCYSAFRFLRDTLNYSKSPKVNLSESELKPNKRGEPIRSPRNYQLPPLLRAWLPAFFLFISSVILIALGSWLIN